MIDEFQRLQIEIRAIEQPLDLSVPESKLMLAIYLASPEVENDRRSLNVFNGMRKAKKEGRYMGSAPIGYKNSRDERNRPIITPSDIAPMIVRAFELLASGNFHQEEVRKTLNTLGLICSRNNFNKLIRNPVYAGKIRVTGYRDEEPSVVAGTHEPIVSENLFYKVQEIILGNRPKNVLKNTSRYEFPLRGYLVCPRCGKHLSGSTALSKTKRLYYYYHCRQGCKEIISTEKVHKALHNLFKNIEAQSEVMEVFEKIIKKLLNESDDARADQVDKIQKALIKNKERINKATQMMLDSEIDSTQFKEIKIRYEEINTTLIRNKASLELDKVNYSNRVQSSFNLLRNLDRFYSQGDVKVKQQIVSLMFSEKLVFKNEQLQTPKMNEVLTWILLNNKKIEAKKRDR